LKISNRNTLYDALKSKHIPERAEAIRELEKNGTLQDLDTIMTHITKDKSAAIRFISADAFSDILSRYRFGPSRSELSQEERLDWLNKIMEISLQDNIAASLIIAVLDIPQSLGILLSGFRHPHSEVRLSSAVGLLRYLQSVSKRREPEIEPMIVSILIDTTLYSDSVVYLAELCVAFNYRTALPLLEHYSFVGEHGRLLDIAKERLSSPPNPCNGLWLSDGNDAGEYNPNTGNSKAFLIVSDEKRLFRELEDEEWTVLEADEQLHTLFFRRIGFPSPDHVIQIKGRTFFKLSNEEMDVFLQSEGVAKNYSQLESGGQFVNPKLELLAQAIAIQIPEETSKNWRDLGGVWLRAGHPERALASLETALLGKRTPVDTHFFIGEALSKLNRTTEAHAAWEYCLSKSRSDRPAHVKWCKDRLSGEENG
jgi:hypothetical protein